MAAAWRSRRTADPRRSAYLRGALRGTRSGLQRLIDRQHSRPGAEGSRAQAELAGRIRQGRARLRGLAERLEGGAP